MVSPLQQMMQRSATLSVSGVWISSAIMPLMLHMQSLQRGTLLTPSHHGGQLADRARAAYEASSSAARAGRAWHHVNTDWTHYDYSQGSSGYTSRISELRQPGHQQMY